MATDIDDDLDAYEDEATDSDAAEPAGPKLSDQWQSMPLRRKAAWVGGTLLIGAIVLGTCRGGGKHTPTASTTPTTTVSVEESLAGLPDLSPFAAATIRPEDFDEFANEVRSVTADGTSVCDVFFGFVVKVPADGGKPNVHWALTTPAMQRRAVTGVYLPSSKYPSRAFYGAPCNVASTDVVLTTTTSAQTTTTVKAG